MPHNARRSLLIVAVLAAGVPWAGAATEARMPGPAPIVRGFDASSINAQCEKCHSAIAAEWRESLHHQAYTSPSFQAALAKEPEPFCRGCHAPEGNPFSPSKAAADLGVGCVTCHVLDRAPLAIPKSGTAAPHPVAREARFATPAACAACHAFDFPDRKTPLAMQATIAEHARGPAKDKRCAHCHMPVVDGHRSHRFTASRDEAFVKSAVDVAARRTSRTEVVVEITATPKLGHAFPTGDLFRRFSVSIEQGGAKKTLYFARRFGPREEQPGKILRVEVGDDRVEHGKPAHAVFTVHGGTSVHYRVAYERVQSLVADDGHDAEIAGFIVLAEGTLE